MGVYACALGGDDGRELLMCCAPDFYEHTRAPVREAILVSTTSPSPTPGCPDEQNTSFDAQPVPLPVPASSAAAASR